MSLAGKLRLLRRAYGYAIPLACVFSFAAMQSAVAQSSTSNDFASSTQALLADSDGVDSLAAPSLAAPSPAAGVAGQERSYGYHDKSITSHLTFEGGGGANAPIGNDQPFITWGGNFTVGGGLHFSRGISLLAEYQFIDDKLPGNLIAETGANGGDAHIWSLTIDPVIDLLPKAKNSVYITGGGGFYRKVTNFTDPEEAEYCEYYYCGIETENAVVGHFSSNQGGWNIGGGFTHRVGGVYDDSRMKLFAEVRYLDVLTPASQIAPNGLGTATVSSGTKLIPVTLGVRW